MRDNLVKDEDDEETVKRKLFNQKIVASKKPYFMTYIYPKLKKENNEYIKNNEIGCIRRFYKYGITSLSELKEYPRKNKEMIDYYDYYERLMPVGTNNCVVNRITKIFEREFNNYIPKLSKLPNSHFDYRILKSNSEYSKANYNSVLKVYEEYIRRAKDFQRVCRTEKVEKFDVWIKRQTFLYFFTSECDRICSNENELCDIVLDICYQSEKSKQFAWDISREVILQNLLKKCDYKIQYPYCVEDNGEFEYCGKQFNMNTKIIEVESNSDS